MSICAEALRLQIMKYASAAKDNFYGTQFHPEKKVVMWGKNLGNFLKL
jgi:imidazoleglycerol phosphate synthase glutamine amidotransferase subunit HisH